MYDQNDYQLHYENLNFEDRLREFRMEYIVNYIQGIKSDKILEIGSGCWPLSDYFDDYKTLDIIEPGEHFYEIAKSKTKSNDRVSLTNGFIEDVYPTLKNDYDIILIGGFLHEIDNPEEVLSTIKKIASPETIIITFVPNADSFHRLLAFETGIIKSKYEFSENDSLFGRRNVFNKASITSLFVTCGFSILTTDTYFIKPFTHEQMEQLLTISFLNHQLLLGFSKMIEYMPDLGAEIFMAVTILI